MLFFANIRLIFENYFKYGLIDPAFLIEHLVYGDTFVYIINVAILLHFSVVLAFYTEKGLSTAKSRFTFYLIHFLNVTAVLAGPLLMSIFYKVSAISNSFILIIVVITAAKLISYIAFWNDVRYFRYKHQSISKSSKIDESLQKQLYQEIDDVINNYPSNLTLYNLVEFMFFPVLCYQYKFPRTSRVSKRNLIKYAGGFLVCSFFQMFILNQFIGPVLENSLQHMENRDLLKILERLLKLSVPSTYAWILMFYGGFHFYLNFLAEITCFADRSFYKDWWNSYFVDEYWRKWNIVAY